MIESNRIGFDLRGELNLVTAPTLIVSGREDFVCGPPAAQDLANGIKGSQVVMLEQTGHMMYMEQPEAFRTCRREVPERRLVRDEQKAARRSSALPGGQSCAVGTPAQHGW